MDGRLTLHFAGKALLLAGLLFHGFAVNAQAVATAKPKGPTLSLGDSLQRAGNRQLHILYVHGIASGGEGDFDSWGLRRGICDFVKDCISPAGEMDGATEYADQREFKLNSPPPDLKYFGEPIWKTDASGLSEEWNASAPFVIHWKLARRVGPAVYVDEIHWWPLVFALKCREVVREDAALIGPDIGKIGACSDRKPDPKQPGRFASYDWITKAEMAELSTLPNKGALVNRKMKASLMDWGFSDAVMALGPMRQYVLDGIRQLILKSVSVSAEGVRGGAQTVRADEEYVIVSHSLGSYLMFSALGLDPDQTGDPELVRENQAFEQVLARTGLVYFFANQLRFLGLANLDQSSGANLISHLDAWGRYRCTYLQSLPGAGQSCRRPQIVALNDPSDLLSWTVPQLNTVEVHNVTVKNAAHRFWLFESPAKAHNNYARNRGAIAEMLKLTAPTPTSGPDSLPAP